MHTRTRKFRIELKKYTFQVILFKFRKYLLQGPGYSYKRLPDVSKLLRLHDILTRALTEIVNFWHYCIKMTWRILLMGVKQQQRNDLIEIFSSFYREVHTWILLHLCKLGEIVNGNSKNNTLYCSGHIYTVSIVLILTT